MDNFFQDLASFDVFDGVVEFERYTDVPESWFIVITDVKGSTAAIEDGRYKEVNMLGASSIIAAINAVKGVSLPYVFGGDGATLVVPASAHDAVVSALVGLSVRAQHVYGLGLRVGVVPVCDLITSGHRVQVAKYCPSPDVQLAMFSGGGLAIADAWIKSADKGPGYAKHPASDTPEPDLDGLQCRWDPIDSRNGNMLSILIVALDEDEAEKAATYHRVLAELDRLTDTNSVPVHKNITLARDLGSFAAEAKILTGKSSGIKLNIHKAKAAAKAAVAREMMASGRKVGSFDGRTYRDQVIENTDFRKFDDCLRMVLDASPAVEEGLRKTLEREFARGTLAFGIHASNQALMTCLVFDLNHNHVHFVDGGDGGYALAAKGLKHQLASQD